MSFTGLDPLRKSGGAKCCDDAQRGFFNDVVAVILGLRDEAARVHRFLHGAALVFPHELAASLNIA
jgi:hypothetical protein